MQSTTPFLCPRTHTFHPASPLMVCMYVSSNTHTHFIARIRHACGMVCCCRTCDDLSALRTKQHCNVDKRLNEYYSTLSIPSAHYPDFNKENHRHLTYSQLIWHKACIVLHCIVAHYAFRSQMYGLYDTVNCPAVTLVMSLRFCSFYDKMWVKQPDLLHAHVSFGILSPEINTIIASRLAIRTME